MPKPGPARRVCQAYVAAPRRPSASRLPALAAGLAFALPVLPSSAFENVYLTGVPDYEWHLGCFGTATGNLAGFWDRHGFDNFYTGPTTGGVAPIHSFGANGGIRSLWTSAAGLDGRPVSRPGHEDDYYRFYQDTGSDPYAAAGRAEHEPDCIGDFIGLNQRKWADLGGECTGNIDGYSFNFFDRDGHRRDNFVPRDAGGRVVPDIQSGLRRWAESRGSTVDTFSQLADFNPDCTAGQGFTFAELKAEIDAGYPVLLFMQPFDEFSRTVGGISGLNPEIHGMLAYGYLIQDDGTAYVRYRTSWASGDRQFSPWSGEDWTPEQQLNLPLRGVIGFHPRPRLREYERRSSGLRLTWEGPLSVLRDEVTGAESPVHRYVVERALPGTLPLNWEAVTQPVADFSAEVPIDAAVPGALYRVRLLEGASAAAAQPD